MKAHIQALGFAIMFVCLATVAASVWTAPVVQGNDSGGTDSNIEMFAEAGGSGEFHWREVYAFLLREDGEMVDDPMDVYVTQQEPKWYDGKYNPSGYEFGNLMGIRWDDDPEPKIRIYQEDFDQYSPNGINLSVWVLGEYVREGPGGDELRQAYLKVQIERPITGSTPVAWVAVNGKWEWSNLSEENDVTFIAETENEITLSFDAFRSWGGEGEITHWLWDFNGDGAYGKQGERGRNISRTLTANQTYWFGLIVCNDEGARSEIFNFSITIDLTPVISIISVTQSHTDAFVDQEVHLNITLTNTGTSGAQHVDIHFFIDNAFQNKQTVDYLHNDGSEITTRFVFSGDNASTNPGFRIKFEVWYDGEKLITSQELIIRVTIDDTTPPSADAGPDQILDQDTEVTFDGSGSTDDVGIVNFTWTFHDGIGERTLYGISPKHTFIVPGVYNVTLNVTDEAGHRDTDTMIITVLDIIPPSAHAGSDQTVNEGMLVNFNGSASTDNVGIVEFSWNFYDGQENVTLLGVSPSPTFMVPGIYTVTLTVTDAAGNTDRDTMVVTVIDITPPVANAGQDQIVDEGAMVTVYGDTSTDNVGVVNFTWTFKDGTGDITVYGSNPTHIFPIPGIYVVTLTVSDGAGLTDTDTMTVTVIDITPPTAHAGHDQTVDEGIQVTFDGRLSTDNVGIVNFTWTFHDGQEDIMFYGATPSHTFRMPGNYTVTLTVTDAAGLTDSGTMVVTVLNAELAIHSVVYTPQKPKDGDTVTIIVTLKNTGEATARNVTVAVKMSTVLIKTLEFDDIPVGEMAAMQFPWTVLTGTYTLEVELSYTGGEDTHTRTFEVRKKDSDSPGFDVLGALAAVGLAVVLFGKRRG